MNAQTFIFCIGATKAGTSWLFDYLFHHEECHFSTVKELHYFDALEQGTGDWLRSDQQARLNQARADIAHATDEHPMLWKKQLVEDLEGWMDAFDGSNRDDEAYLRYAGQDRSDARLIGDFTPAYALLKEATFKAMSRLTERVRFVYLLRDPVDRIWSNIRMVVGHSDPVALSSKVDDVVSGGDQNIIERSNYRRTLNRLSAAMPREMFHIEYYERLFTPEAIERLCVFLGITPSAAPFERVIHKSAEASLSTESRQRLQTALKPQYNFVEKFMGELPSEWTQKMVNA